MNQAFDYNGVVVAQSAPKKVLRTVKKTIHIDSADRDTTKYHTNGDFWVYLPRNYQNIVSIRLKDAQFPPFPYVHTGSNVSTEVFSGDPVSISTQEKHYFVISLEGLNKVDETSVSADRSTFTDSFFAKIPTLYQIVVGDYFNISYNDHSSLENIATYSPPIANLDRLHITTRLHSQQNKNGFVYFSTETSVSDPNFLKGNFNLTLEIEYLENAFTDFSSFETRLAQRS